MFSNFTVANNRQRVSTTSNTEVLVDDGVLVDVVSAASLPCLLHGLLHHRKWECSW